MSETTDNSKAGGRCAPALGSAPERLRRLRKMAVQVVNAAEYARKRGEGWCPYCHTVWVSSINYTERHGDGCPLPMARSVLNSMFGPKSPVERAAPRDSLIS
jgi:hypothetical protein